MVKSKIDLPVLLAILLVGIASLIGINQYHYGMWNQYIALPWLFDLMDPSLYPNDPLIAQRINSPSFYNLGLAKIASWLNGDVALTHFILYVVVLMLTLISFYSLSYQIFKDRRAGLFTLVMLIFSFPVIGSIAVWDSVLMERTVTLPILIFSLVFILQKRWLWAVVLQALAFNIHPLSSLYLICCSWLGVMLWMGKKERYYYYWPILIALIVPVLYLRHLHPSDTSSFDVNELWMKLMYLRNAHHSFPSEFPLMDIVRAILIAIVYSVIIWKSNIDAGLKRFFIGLGLGVLTFIIAGTLFTEFIPIRIAIQLQFYRSFVFLVILSIILWSGLMIKKPQPWLIVLGIGVAAQYFYGSMSKSLAFLVVAAVSYLILRRSIGSRWIQPLGIAGVVLLMGITAFWQRGGMKIRQGHQQQTWYELQHWSKENTAADAIFIESPSQAGFRVESLRSSYGTWHDGTKVFFSEEYGKLWWSRMSSLGCTDPDNLASDYRKNTTANFQSIWGDLDDLHSEGYVICFEDMPLSELELVYQNEDYLVYKL